MIEELESLAREAGAAILAVYHKTDFQVQIKADHSPVTEADFAANRILVEGLKKFGNLPYISEEEAPQSYDQPPSRYWLIDPLDGTKEFIARRDHFTVNIALIENKAPGIAVVYAPVSGEMFSGFHGVYRENGVIVRDRNWAPGRVLLSSRSHPEPLLKEFIERNGITDHIRIGSSIKFCHVANGRAHLYPRFGPLRAWDTAAGDGIARAAGCRLVNWATGLPPEYEYEKPWTEGFCLSSPLTSVMG